MTKTYDWPTRLFHWFFAALFVGAFTIAKNVDDESPTYAYHMLLGILLVAVVLLRLIWGFIGSRYARFSSFSLNPLDLIRYFKNMFTSKDERHLGHNPASSWAGVLMMIFVLGLGYTGYMMTSRGGNKEAFEDAHELLANAFLIVAILHVLGIIVHTLKFRDAIGMSMIHGDKRLNGKHGGILSTHPIVGLLFLVVVGLFGLNLNRNYDRTTQNLNLFGYTLQLGESESDESEKEGTEASGTGGQGQDSYGDDD
jgi:cytochrome b